MYTRSSTAGRWVRASAITPLLTLWAALPAEAQDPVRLPTMVVQAPAMPGPRLMVGVVRDTAGNAIADAEVAIPGVEKRLYTNAEGVFRFEGVSRGTHWMRARKLGYAPQVRQFAVDTAGGIAEFELLPIPRALPAIVSSANRLGLTGVVGDTAFDTVEGAEVRVLATGLHTRTDSLGSFYLPAESGRYMVSIRKAGFRDRLVGVTIPSDSGRRITAWLQPSTWPIPAREVHNVDDLQQRLALAKPQHSVLYTREELHRLRVEWLYDAVMTTSSKMDVRATIDRDCMAIVNGGPSVANLGTITVDEVESVEVYANGTQARGAPGSVSLGNRGSGVKRAPEWFSNTSHAGSLNQIRYCPVTVYVWLR